MEMHNNQYRFSPKLLAITVLAVFGLAHADEDEIAQFIKPDSLISIEVDAASGGSKDRAIYGQYDGQRKKSTNLLLNVDMVKRDDAIGLWTILEGYNLGLDNSELRFSQQKQGDWKYSAEYSELVRHDPRTINTGLLNAGTTTPTVVSPATPGTGTNLDLNIKRKEFSLGAEKWLSPDLMFEASAKNEDRKGARLSGTGLICAPPLFSGISNSPCSAVTGAMLMLPEPINSRTKQLEVKMNYSASEKFMLSGGYYGSFFTNANGSLNPTVNGNLWNPDGTPIVTGTDTGNILAGYLQQPVALPPDNQAHQLYFSGNYAFSTATRANFKYAYSHATQHEDFSSMGLNGAPSGVSNLGGVVDSNSAQFGLTTHPISKLSMLGNLRYENKADKTPIALYNGANTNDLNSSKKLNGKLEASYQLPDNYRAILGFDYESVHRDRPVSTAAVWNATIAPLSGLREETRELGYRAELRRSLSETLNASVSYAQSKRDGGSWLSIAPANATGAYPMTMMNRNRDKISVSADWTPIDSLSLQFRLEDGKDAFTSPTEKGLRDTGMKSYGVDAALNISESIALTGYMNQSNQILHVDHNVGYLAELENINTSMGVGVTARQSSRLELGVNLAYMDDSNRYKQSMATGAAIIGGGLPDVTYRETSLKLFGKYALQKNADIFLNLIHRAVKFDEWAWGYNGKPFSYSDNSTVLIQQSQRVTFLGASYIYKFR